MSHHHKHHKSKAKKHDHKKVDEKFEPQVQSPDQKQVDKAAEHEPQAATPANSGEAVSPNAPGIPKTEPGPAREAKDDEKQEVSEGGAQGEVPEDQDHKLFNAMKEIVPALKKFKESLEGNTHLDEDVKRLLDAANKIIGKMDSDHVGNASAIPEAPQFTGDLDEKAKEEGKAGTADQAMVKDQEKDINNTESNSGKLNDEGKVEGPAFGPAPSEPVASLPEGEPADKAPEADLAGATPASDAPAGELKNPEAAE